MANVEREILGWDEFGGAVRELAATVHGSGFAPDIVVAIARGGLLLAGAIAYALDRLAGAQISLDDLPAAFVQQPGGVRTVVSIGTC